MIEADSFDEWAMFAEHVFTPNAVWEQHGGNTIEGRGAIVAFVRDYWSIWDDHHHYVEENVDLGHGVIWGSSGNTVASRAATRTLKPDGGW